MCLYGVFSSFVFFSSFVSFSLASHFMLFQCWVEFAGILVQLGSEQGLNGRDDREEKRKNVDCPGGLIVLDWYPSLPLT